MISRNLRIALLGSLTVHVLAMSAVSIIGPEEVKRRSAYTRIDFLGAVFQKTAFDIMLENTTSFFKDGHGHVIQVAEGEYLEKVKVPKQKLRGVKSAVCLEDEMDDTVKGFLTGDKAVPRFIANTKPEVFVRGTRTSGSMRRVRKIVYRADTSFIQHGFYGKKRSFKAKFKALLGSDGKIKRTELLATTGYPQLDMKASRLVKDRVIEPEERVPGKDEWCEVEVILNTAGG